MSGQHSGIPGLDGQAEFVAASTQGRHSGTVLTNEKEQLFKQQDEELQKESEAQAQDCIMNVDVNEASGGDRIAESDTLQQDHLQDHSIQQEELQREKKSQTQGSSMDLDDSKAASDQDRLAQTKTFQQDTMQGDSVQQGEVQIEKKSEIEGCAMELDDVKAAAEQAPFVETETLQQDTMQDPSITQEELQEKPQTDDYSMEVDDVKSAPKQNRLTNTETLQQATMHDNSMHAELAPVKGEATAVEIKRETDVNNISDVPQVVQIQDELDPISVNQEEPDVFPNRDDHGVVHVKEETQGTTIKGDAEDSDMEAPDSPDLTGALEAALEREASAHTGQENESADQQREWETDSSPYDSSSDSSSEDDSEDEEYGDHPLLSMEETARILMAEINADENDGAKSRAAESAIRSKHELLNEVLPKPDVTITSDMEIKSLGNVKFIVDNTIVIQGLAPGHHQVIDLESVLCKEDRTVIGALHEVLGNVTSPLYTVGFNNREAIQELQLAVGTPIFFSVPHAKYVLTQPLRQVKGTDASNLHDEEVPEDEMEFSDDEKEQLFKKQKKLQNQTKRRGGQPLGQRRSSPSAVSIATSATLDYDEDEEGPYRPLARPTGFGSSTLPPRPDHSAYQNRSHSNGGRPGGNSRGRGNRGRGGYRGNDQRAHQQGGPIGAPTDAWLHHQSTQPPQHSPQVPPSHYGVTQQQWPMVPQPPPVNFAVPPPLPQFTAQQQHQPAWNQAQNQPFTFTPPVPNVQVPPPPIPQLGLGSIPIPPPGWPGVTNAERASQANVMNQLRGQQGQQGQHAPSHYHHQGYWGNGANNEGRNQ